MQPDPSAPVVAPPEGATRAPWDGLAIADATVVMLLTRLASVGLAWVLEVVLVRMLGPEDWGSMSRFLTLVSAFTIAQLGLPESVLYFTARSAHARTGLHVTARTSGLLVLLGCALAAPLVAFPSAARWLLGSQGALAVTPLMLFVVSDLAFAPLPSYLQGRRRPKLAAILALGTRLPIAASVVVAVLSGVGLEAALYGMALGSLVSLLGGWAIVLGVARRDGKAFDRVPLREQVTFSLPVGLTRLVQIGNVKLDKYIVMTVFAESVFGTYYLGATEFPVPALVCNVVMTVMMADLVLLAGEPERDRLVALWHASIRKIALVTLPACAFLMAFAGPIFQVLYAGAHDDAATQFRIFQLLLFARVTNYTNVSLALGQPRVPLVAAGIALALNAGLSLVFVHTVGLLGPAIATVCAVYLSTLYTLGALRSALGVSWRALFPMGAYLRTLAAAAASLAPAAAVWLVELSPTPRILAGAALYAASFLWVGRLLGVVGAEERRFLRSLRRLEFLSHRSSASAGS